MLFGGWGGPGVGSLGDTWELDGNAWVPRTPLPSPPASEGGGMAWDLAQARMVLFGPGIVGW